MALPFIAGVVVGAVGVVAYKNRDSLKEKSKLFFEDIKSKSESFKKEVEDKIVQTKEKFETKKESQTEVAQVKPKRKYTKKSTEKPKEGSK